ncbi:hypothetical protein LINPERPRIM_LOCUS6048, partial [Linum perenne]
GQYYDLGPTRKNDLIMLHRLEFAMMECTGLRNGGGKLGYSDEHGDRPRPLPNIHLMSVYHNNFVCYTHQELTN